MFFQQISSLPDIENYGLADNLRVVITDQEELLGPSNDLNTIPDLIKLF